MEAFPIAVELNRIIGKIQRHQLYYDNNIMHRENALLNNIIEDLTNLKNKVIENE
jgi:hypothetical protein